MPHAPTAVARASRTSQASPRKKSPHKMAPGKRAPRKHPWTPDSHVELLYQMVRFEGMSQREAAACFGISQATVSRVVNRYERWRIRGNPEQHTGELSREERIRAQRWLTFERNEALLANALRMARKLETQGSRHTQRLRTDDNSGQSDRVIENLSYDRAGEVCRYLRLAFRINMEQHKLVREEPLEDLPPLTDEEYGEEAGHAAIIAAEFARLRGEESASGEGPGNTGESAGETATSRGDKSEIRNPKSER